MVLRRENTENAVKVHTAAYFCKVGFATTSRHESKIWSASACSMVSVMLSSMTLRSSAESDRSMSSGMLSCWLVPLFV